ncbi:MAG: DUF421 domain-containing protein [Bradymonadaceae bacterium]
MDDSAWYIPLLYNGMTPILHTLLIGTVGYLALVVIVRLAGKRTLSQLDVFDTIIAVAIGSTFGRALTASRVALADAVTAFALLAILQWLIARFKIRWPSTRRVISEQPTLLYWDDDFLESQMATCGVTRDELYEAARQKGAGSLQEIDVMVLEPSGQVSVIRSVPEESDARTTMQDVVSE